MTGHFLRRTAFPAWDRRFSPRTSMTVTGPGAGQDQSIELADPVLEGRDDDLKAGVAISVVMIGLTWMLTVA